MIFCPFDVTNTHLNRFTFLLVRIFGGIRFDDWTGILDHFTIFQHHLSLDTRLNLFRCRQFGFLLRHNFFCKKKTNQKKTIKSCAC